MRTPDERDESTLQVGTAVGVAMVSLVLATVSMIVLEVLTAAPRGATTALFWLQAFGGGLLALWVLLRPTTSGRGRGREDDDHRPPGAR